MFGAPSAWQVVTGNFKGDEKTGYVLLDGDRAHIPSSIDEEVMGNDPEDRRFSFRNR